MSAMQALAVAPGNSRDVVWWPPPMPQPPAASPAHTASICFCWLPRLPAARSRSQLAYTALLFTLLPHLNCSRLLLCLAQVLLQAAAVALQQAALSGKLLHVCSLVAGAGWRAGFLDTSRRHWQCFWPCIKEACRAQADEPLALRSRNDFLLYIVSPARTLLGGSAASIMCDCLGQCHTASDRLVERCAASHCT